jgi:hypothetical protein
VQVAGGHYAVYHGDGFERAVSAQLAFLQRHLPADTAPISSGDTVAERQEQ